MDISEALNVMTNLFDWLYADGQLNDEELSDMNIAEDVIRNFVREHGGI